MKIIFFGSGSFALPALIALVSSPHEILGVVTPKDKPRGRGLKVTESPVRALAGQKGIRILDLSNVNDASSLKVLEGLRADVFVTVSYGQILSPRFLNLSPKGCVNLHPSLLPKFRGASPVRAALLKGEKETGVTTFKIVEKLDAGDIYFQESLPLSGDENAQELSIRLAEMGAKCVVRTLDLMETGQLQSRPQNESRATKAPKLKKEDSWIDWKLGAKELHNHVRAFFGWPGSRTTMSDKELILLKTTFEDEGDASSFVPGELVRIHDSEGLCVATGRGFLWIKELKLAGKRAMPYRDFLNGHPLKTGVIFGGNL